MRMDNIWKSVTNRVGTVRVQNVLNPLLWAFAVALIALIPISFSSSLLAQVVVSAIIGILVVALVGAYGYFAMKDPDRLQSEEYQLKQQQIDAMIRRVEDKGIETVEDASNMKGQDALPSPKDRVKR